MKRLVHIILIVLLVVGSSVLVAMKMSGHKDKSIRVSELKLHEADIANKHLADTAISLLRSGYVVLRMGLGADSRLLAQFSRKDKSYSHCGIVMIEKGQPYVYHSIGGEDNPDARLRRDPASVFFSPLHNTALAIVKYDLDDERVGELRKVVNTYYQQRPKFDMKFDLASDDKLYCAEFVYKAVNKAADDTAYIRTTSAAGIRFVGIDDLFINPHAHMVWQTRFK